MPKKKPVVVETPTTNLESTEPNSGPTSSQTAPSPPSTPPNTNPESTEPNSGSSQSQTDPSSNQIDPKELIKIVICQTGGASAGAETLIAQMTDEEIELIAGTITVQDQLVRIADSIAYFAALADLQGRLDQEQKATVE